MKRKNKIVTIALLTSMIMSLVGCSEEIDKSNEDTLLKNTPLYEGIVASVDGEIEIIKNVKFDDYTRNSHSHDHYINLTSGEFLAHSNTKCTFYPVRTTDNIVALGSINSYLTSEEISKLTTNNYTDEDIVKIIIRIKNDENIKNELKDISNEKVLREESR